jgi:hypothetical protein
MRGWCSTAPVSWIEEAPHSESMEIRFGVEGQARS